MHIHDYSEITFKKYKCDACDLIVYTSDPFKNIKSGILIKENTTRLGE